MDKVERAKSILDYYKKQGIQYSSNLMDTDYKTIKKQKTSMKIFKYTTTEEVISGNLANQIINYYTLSQRITRLDDFANKKARTEEGMFIFTYKVTPDYDAANYAEYLKSVGIRLLRVIRNKKDNAIFNEKLAEFNDIYSEVCEQEAFGYYGVHIGYSIISILPLDEEMHNRVKSIEKLADSLLKSKEQSNNKSNHELEM